MFVKAPHAERHKYLPFLAVSKTLSKTLSIPRKTQIHQDIVKAYIAERLTDHSSVRAWSA